MKRLVLAAAMLLSCAAHRAQPQARLAQAQPHWSAQERESVRLQCQAQMGQGEFCDCLTTKLEALSPDPDTELTREELRAGLQACQAVAPDSTATSG